MTSDASSSEPRKRSWKRLIVVLPCVVAAITIALLSVTPKEEPVKVWFVRSTNELGVKKLVFRGSNGISTDIRFSACVVTGATAQATVQDYLRTNYSYTSPLVFAGASFDFALDVPPNDVPYGVEWEFIDGSWGTTLSGRFRMACSKFCYTHRMPRLAPRFIPKAEPHYISSTEIKE